MTRQKPLRLEDLEEIRYQIISIQSELTAAPHPEDPITMERCSRVELVLRVAAFLTQTDPDDQVTQDPAGYIQSKLNNAIGQFDLKVVRES